MRNLPLLALLLTVMLLTPVQGTPVIDDVTTKQTAAPDGRQPSEENTTFWIFGDSALSRCYGHFFFDGNTSEEGSSNTGNGLQNVDSGRISIDITCRMDPILEKEFTLKEGANIVITLYIEAWGDTGSDCSGNPCQDLTLTLLRGGKEVAQSISSIPGSGQERIDWNIAVNETNNIWDKQEGNPALQIEFEIQASSGAECILLDCSADFILYYAHPDEERDPPYNDECDGCNSNLNFPIENITQLGSVDDDDDDGDGGGLSGVATPGFGAALTLLSMMAAIVHIQRRRTDTVDETEAGKVHL